MNLTDFMIIYLACGSPIGVWFYFNHKTDENVLSKSLFAALFWVIFILQFLSKRFSNDFSTTEKVLNVRRFQKNIEKSLPKQFSIFEFREIFDRYAGLTVADKDSSNDTFQLNNDFSARFNSRNEKISAKCLQRINRRKLKAHQIFARKDFLQIIHEISEQTDEPLVFLNVNLDFVKVLNDKTAETEIEKFIEETSQTIGAKPVKQKEVELWNNEKLKLPTIEQTNFITMNSKPQAIRMTTKD